MMDYSLCEEFPLLIPHRRLYQLIWETSIIFKSSPRSPASLSLVMYLQMGNQTASSNNIIDSINSLSQKVEEVVGRDIMYSYLAVLFESNQANFGCKFPEFGEEKSCDVSNSKLFFFKGIEFLRLINFSISSME